MAYKRVVFDKRKTRARNPKRYVTDQNGCHVWQLSFSTHGSPITTQKGKRILAHRQAYEEKYGKIPVGLVLDHVCKNRKCINADHMEPVTQAENVHRGRLTRLTQEQVDTIRKLRASGRPRKEIAEMFGITPGYVGDIFYRRGW